MQIALSSLKQYLDIDLSPQQIDEHLTNLGIEVDAIDAVTPDFEGVVVGRVVEAGPHPQADRLRIATVFDGHEKHQVVCGAPNCREGILVAFAPPGAQLQKSTPKPFTLSKATIRGIDSHGMLCSEKELGMGDSHEGIIELTDAALGSSLNALFSDYVFSISLTPNLAHCLSVYGIARELSASLAIPLKAPQQPPLEEHLPSTESSVRVEIQSPDKCPRYCCRVIRGVTIAPSPLWLRMRLQRAGLNSINNVIDITNLVMLELGQPLHAFDLRTLQGTTIKVGPAISGEHFIGLDNSAHVLTPEVLTIRDAEGPIAVAGVIGGRGSSITDQTQDILLESAHFNPRTIYRGRRAVSTSTEASKRFERGTDPNGVRLALDTAAALILKLAGGEAASGLIDTRPEGFPRKQIPCRIKRLNQLLGTQLSTGEIETLFHRLGCTTVCDSQELLTVHVPTFRCDLQAEIDLTEEIARLYGYQNIVPDSVQFKSSTVGHTPIYLFETAVRERLLSEGLQELLTCDLISSKLAALVPTALVPSESSAISSLIRVLNPVSEEHAVLRPSLLPGLLQAVKTNLNQHQMPLWAYEVGRIHLKIGSHYKEQSIAGIVLSGDSSPPHWNDRPAEADFFDLKGIIENVLRGLNIPAPNFERSAFPCFHPGQQAKVIVEGIEVGSFGRIHPALLRQLDISRPVLFGELSLHDLIQFRKNSTLYQPIALYPGSDRDWTLTLPEALPTATVLNAIKETHSPLLCNVHVVGLYRSEALGIDKKNLTLRLSYQDPNRTLSGEQVDIAHKQIVTQVLSAF